MRYFFALMMGMSFLNFSATELRSEDMPRTIAVTGQGDISVEPDMAKLIVAVQFEADDAARAMDIASAATGAILTRLDVSDVDAGDVRSGAVRLQPVYSSSALSSGRNIAGYRAQNSVEVTLRDLDQLGGLLAALVADGANRLDSLWFGLQDPTAAEDAARQRAVADAMRRAALYADAADVPLGQVLTISEMGGGGYRTLSAGPMEMGSLAASSPQYDVPTAPGKIEVSASITMVFEIAR